MYIKKLLGLLCLVAVVCFEVKGSAEGSSVSSEDADERSLPVTIRNEDFEEAKKSLERTGCKDEVGREVLAQMGETDWRVFYRNYLKSEKSGNTRLRNWKALGIQRFAIDHVQAVNTLMEEDLSQLLGRAREKFVYAIAKVLNEDAEWICSVLVDIKMDKLEERESSQIEDSSSNSESEDEELLVRD